MKRRTKWIVALTLFALLAPPAGAANDFSGDANCVGWYKFEPGPSMWDDSSGKGNHLYEQGHPTLDIVNMQEGDGCADFESTEGDVLYLNDADLSSDFPCKSGETNTTFSVTVRFKPESFPSYWEVCSKIDYSGGICWVIEGVSDGRPALTWGYNGGSSYHKYTIDHALTAGQWCFIKAVWDDANDVCAGFVYDYADTSTTPTSNAPAEDLNSENVPFRVGSRNSADYADGLVDELCIFSRVVSDAEATQIRSGTFDFESEPNLVARYCFDKKGLGWDETEKNHLLSTGIPTTADKKQGTGCADFEGDYWAAVWRVDGDLSSGFPGKNGSTNNCMTVCSWMKPESTPADFVRWVIKAGQMTNRSWSVGWDWPSYHITGMWADIEHLDSTRAAVPGTWYHVAFIMDDVNDYAYIRVYDAGNETTYAAEDTSATEPWPMTTASFMVGANSNDTNTGAGDDEYDGLVDEVVIFNRRLTASQIDAIRKGTYPEVGPSLRDWWWWRRRHGG